MTYTYKVYYEDDAITFKRENCYKLVRARGKKNAMEVFKKKFPGLYPLFAV